MAAHLFTPASDEDGEESMPFGLVVLLPAGTSRFQITSGGSHKVLSERAISSQTPQVWDPVITNQTQ